jgi:hypothetical protein
MMPDSLETKLLIRLMSNISLPINSVVTQGIPSLVFNSGLFRSGINIFEMNFALVMSQCDGIEANHSIPLFLRFTCLLNPVVITLIIFRFFCSSNKAINFCLFWINLSIA